MNGSDLEVESPVLERSVTTVSDQCSWAGARQRAKRGIDIGGALLLLVIVLPCLLVIAILVKVDRGPIFYAHRRIGCDGREFGCLKFRSMRPDAQIALENVLARDPAARAEWEATRKLRNDPRVTRVGRLLRATSLDELPQLLNVLRGEMSLVGPRPVTREELETFYAGHSDSAYEAYISVRPGITGLWQVSGRSDTTYNQRIELDMAYARTASLRTDLAILARTGLVVVRRDGAR